MNQEKPYLMLFQRAWIGGKGTDGSKRENSKQYLHIEQNET